MGVKGAPDGGDMVAKTAPVERFSAVMLEPVTRKSVDPDCARAPTDETLARVQLPMKSRGGVKFGN
jgi:hypothetical protein